MTDVPSPPLRPTDPAIWTGRDDGPGPEHDRWYRRVRPDHRGARDGLALIGFASDEGVRRNHGRPGAAAAPEAIRAALAPLAWHAELTLVDAGTVAAVDGDLEGAQAALGAAVADLLDRHRAVVVLGGGHETAYGSYLGRVAAARLAGARVAVLNIDAHFDLREAERATSGTPFRQMARADAAAGREFRYAVVGIAQPANTSALFCAADALGVRYRLDEECQAGHLGQVLAFVDEMIADADAVHLSIDLDALPAATAPGVSAPAAYGVPMEVVHAVCARVAASGRLAVVDIAELSPPYDVDARTARAAARLVTTIAHRLPPAD